MTNLINYQGKKLIFRALIVMVMMAGILTVSPSAASADCMIATTLRLGSIGVDVQCLQTSLGIPVTGVFDNATRSAVINFQVSHKLVADGIFGPISRATWMASFPVVVKFPPGCVSALGHSATTGLPCSGVANLPAGCTSTAGYSPLTGIKCDSSSSNLPAGCRPGDLFSATTGLSCVTNSKLPPGCTTLSGYSTTTGVKCDSKVDDSGDSDDDDDNDDDLSGGEGSASYELISSLSDEEVSEGEDNAEVAGLEIEAEDSDIELTRVHLVFNEATAGSDFEDYVDQVSIWLDGERVGEADGDEFSEDNNWSAMISLDDAVIREGDTGELVVAISAVSDLGADDEGDSWTVDFREIRFKDAGGDTASEDPSVATRTFSFES